MNAKSLYEEDFHAWALEQARVLRELGQRVALPNELDLQHVAEEVEDLGNEQRFQVESNLRQAMIHLIKIAAFPDNPAVAHWLQEVNAFLDTAQDRFSQSMTRAISVQRLWERSVRRVAADMRVAGKPVPEMPADVPFSLDMLIAGDPDPRTLADQIRAAMPSPEAP
jgi:hypothetical protein